MAKNKFQDGPSNRQLRVGEVIRRALSEILSRGEIHDPELNDMSITVGEVKTTPDLRIATAYILPLGGKGKDEAIARLARNKGEIRRLVGKKVAMKHSPDLRFRIDDTFDRMDESRRMFSNEDVRRDLDKPDDVEALDTIGKPDDA